MTRHDLCRAADRRDPNGPPGAIHPELIEAVARGASRDAEAVALFLHELGFMPAADRPIRLPAAFLLQLGAGLRLLAWESAGLYFHRDAGLPLADRAIRDAFGLLDPATEIPTRSPDDLPLKVLTLFACRFTWHARRDLDADVALDDLLGEDDLLDALAGLIWDARHAPTPRQEDCNG